MRLNLQGEEGSTIVESALAFTVMSALIIGILQMCLALYAYHNTAEYARVGSRFAMVRGSMSCTTTPTLSKCNATAAQIKTYVQGQGFPGIVKTSIGVTTTWYTPSTTMPTTWTLCSTGTCNAPGYLVKVVVNYPLTVKIPFAHVPALSFNSTSQMVISQ